MIQDWEGELIQWPFSEPLALRNACHPNQTALAQSIPLGINVNEI